MKVKKIVLIALFIALSFIGANIKIASTIAFDSMPAFFASFAFGPVYGALIGVLGHFLTALTSGFPLGGAIHVIIMVFMGITMAVVSLIYRGLYKKNSLLALSVSSIAGIIINAPLELIALVPVAGKGILAVMPVLTLASALNVILAAVIFAAIPSSLIKKAKA